MISAEEFDTLIDLYAIGMLEPEDSGAVERYAAAHPDGQKRLDAALSDISLLALLAPGIAPPGRLRTRLMDFVRAETTNSQSTVSWWKRLFPSPLPGALGAASFASLAFVVTLSWALNMQSQLNVRTAAPTPVSESNQNVSSGYGSVHPVSMRKLAGSDIAPGARGWLYMDPTDVNALLVTYQLPQLPAGKSYQLWLVNPETNQRISGGVFEVDAEGYGWLRIASPQVLSSFQRVGITVEPLKGSPGPTGARVLGGDL